MWLTAWCVPRLLFFTNDQNPSIVLVRHVVVAGGREHADVTPLEGVFHGGGPARGMDVSVQLTRVA